MTEAIVKLEDVCQQDTPRLVVEFSRGPSGEERFGWGVVGAFQPMSMIGYIARVQSELMFKSPKPCDQPALVIVLLGGGKMDYFVNSDIPVDPLIGMLETIKAKFVDAIAANSASRQHGVGLFDAMGRPLNRRL